MKIAIYPGSFNPFHEGHHAIVRSALKVFDKVIIAQGVNPDKVKTTEIVTLGKYDYDRRAEVRRFEGLFVSFVELTVTPDHEYVVIKGLRNSTDFEYEKVQQYWNEDLDMPIPTIYFISDRDLCHISSSAIRAINKAKGENT